MQDDSISLAIDRAVDEGVRRRTQAQLRSALPVLARTTDALNWIHYAMCPHEPGDEWDPEDCFEPELSVELAELSRNIKAMMFKLAKLGS